MWICLDPSTRGAAGRISAHMMISLSAKHRPDAFRLSAYAGALLLVAASTALGLVIAPRWGTTPVVLLYLPAVLTAAVVSGLWPALLAAVASALAYNYFFTAPYRTFLIHHPADVVTVTVLFLVALVTSHLAGSLREQARLAAAHAAGNATVAGLARRLLSGASEQDIAEVAVEELARLFGCNAVLVTGRDDPHVVASAPARMALAPSDFAAAALTLTTGEPAGRGVQRAKLADWQFRAVMAEHEVTAAAGLARADGAPPVSEADLPLLANLLDQTALALERARLERQAREFAALHERDSQRSALLASIGEDVKPRLTAIAAAARALKREGAGDKVQIATVASEVASLDRYIDGLVTLNPAADQAPIELGAVTIDLFQRSVRKDGAEVHLTPKEYGVLSELAKHRGRVLTHAQLLRNVWGPAQEGNIDYLRVAVGALRRKLESDPAHPRLIVNEPAVGYRLVQPGQN